MTSKQIRYWDVYKPGTTDFKAKERVASLSSEIEAEKLANSQFMESFYGGEGVVRMILQTVYDSAEQYEDAILKKLKEQALAKLSNYEKLALEIEDAPEQSV